MLTDPFKCLTNQYIEKETCAHSQMTHSLRVKCASMCLFVMRIWSPDTTHPECNLHCGVTSLSIKLKWANGLEVGLKPWPAVSDDLMNGAGLSLRLTCELQSQGIVCVCVRERTGSGCCSLWLRGIFRDDDFTSEVWQWQQQMGDIIQPVNMFSPH